MEILSYADDLTPFMSFVINCDFISSLNKLFLSSIFLNSPTCSKISTCLLFNLNDILFDSSSLIPIKCFVDVPSFNVTFNFGFNTNIELTRLLPVDFYLYLNEIISPGLTLPQLYGCFLFAT